MKQIVIVTNTNQQRKNLEHLIERFSLELEFKVLNSFSFKFSHNYIFTLLT